MYSPEPIFGIDKLVNDDQIKVLGKNDTVLIISDQNVYAVHVYQTTSLSKEPIVVSDSESVEIVGAGIFRADNKVYLALDMRDTISEVSGADAATIESLELGFASDKDSVFYLDKKLEGVDPASVSFETQRGYRFMIAGDRVWAPHGCSPVGYKEIPLSELADYTNC